MEYKKQQQAARDSQIVLHRKTRTMRRFVSHYEGPESDLKHKDGRLTVKGLNVLRAALNSPTEHNTVDLGIKAFKRYLKEIPMMTKSVFNAQVRLYKQRAREDYAELVKFKGSFPTMPVNY